jgi:hypothetical protein
LVARHEVIPKEKFQDAFAKKTFANLPFPAVATVSSVF